MKSITKEAFEARVTQIERAVYANFPGCRLHDLTLNDSDYDDLLTANFVEPNKYKRAAFDIDGVVVKAGEAVPRAHVKVTIERPRSLTCKTVRLYRR